MAGRNLHRAAVLDKCKSLIDFQLWPVELEARLEPWLNNFTSAEEPVALALLDSFGFVSEKLLKQLFLSGFHNISNLIRPPVRRGSAFRSTWQGFFDTAIVTLVTGETPSPADSGFIFTRLARDHLNVRQDQLCSPAEALTRLIQGSTSPVIFVDDFVGTGQQFVNTWQRRYRLESGGISFEQYRQARKAHQFFYCPAVATTDGADNIQRNCPGVQLSPGNLLPPENNTFDPKSSVWPTGQNQVGISTLMNASRRAGISFDPSSETYWKGFNKLGLCLAFHHVVPDATLPIFYWDRNGWIPLVTKKLSDE